MRAFEGAEPLVGEVLALRTFRVDESGLLLPLFGDLAWYDGPNTAVCAPPMGAAGLHPPVDPSCRCGFYAYGTVAAAQQHAQARRVLGVVACWGRMVAGTKGVRAEHARLVALWLSPAAPPAVRRRIAQRYCGAELYEDREAMLRDHPPTALPSYVHQRRPHLPNRVAVVAALTVTGYAVLGTLPARWLEGPLLPFWATGLGGCALGALSQAFRRVAGRGVLATLYTILLLWLLAPVAGWVGWALRVPLIFVCASAVASWLVNRRRGYFPVVAPKPPHRRTGLA